MCEDFFASRCAALPTSSAEMNAGKQQCFHGKSLFHSVCLVEKFVLSFIYCRLAAWDDILDPSPSDGGGPPMEQDTFIQAWRGTAAASRAASCGYATIASPTEHCYFDYDVAITDLRAAHSFCPFPPYPRVEGIEDTGAGGVVGGEFNLWTEYLETPEAVDWFAWPRGLATAEVLWAGGGSLQRQSADCRWEPFRLFYARVKGHYPLLKSLGICPGPAFPDGWTEDGDPPLRNKVNPALMGSWVETSLPTDGEHYVEFAVDGYPETYFKSAREVRAGDTVELHFGPVPLEGCIVVRVRSGRFGRSELRHGVLELRLSPVCEDDRNLNLQYEHQVMFH